MSPNAIPLQTHSLVAVISDNYVSSHNHDMSWLNRRLAPIPTQLEQKISAKIKDNPNLSIFQKTIKRYMRDKTGLRQDIKNSWDFYPDLDDPCINITNKNRLKYQFYKVLQEIHGLHANDQARLQKYIDDLREDDERYDIRRPTKRQRITHQIANTAKAANIPRKAPTKTQQPGIEQQRQKRERRKLKQTQNPYVPLSVFENQAKDKEERWTQHINKRVAERQEQLKEVEPYLLEDIDIDMHDTISNNVHIQDTMRNKRPKRSIKPSNAMKQSQQYMNKMLPSRNNVYDPSEDEDDDSFI